MTSKTERVDGPAPTPPWIELPHRPLVLAFGGNALLPDPDRPDRAAERAAAFSRALLMVLPDHAGLVLVHGNGPQVGTILLRVEATRDRIPPDTLDVMVAETQGSIGYLLSRSLRTVLAQAKRDVEVATVVTQVVVDPDDPAMAEPSKPVGPFYTRDQAAQLAEEFGWKTVDVANRGVRRVVPSPQPVDVVEIHTIADAARHGHLVVAGGGGGIPVARANDGSLDGVEAVIDKDRTASLLATSLRAGGFVILTEVAHVSTGFGTPDEEPLLVLSVSEAQRLHDAGEFPPGSMGPKIEASIAFTSRTGRPSLITSVEGLRQALRGTDGTWIVPD